MLYATIIHYYSTLQVNSTTRKGNNNAGGGSKSNKENGNINNNTATTTGAVIEQKTKTETSKGDANLNATLQQIHHVLCTPGTRTLLMLAERNEIAARMAANYYHKLSEERSSETVKQSNDEMTGRNEDQEANVTFTSELGTESSPFKDGKLLNKRVLPQQDSTATCTSEEGAAALGHEEESETLSRQLHEPRRSESTHYFDNISRLLSETHLNAKDNYSSCSSGASSTGKGKKKNKTTTKSKDDSSRTLLQSLDRYLQQALQRKINFYRHLRQLAKQAQQQQQRRHIKDGDHAKDNSLTGLAEYIGLEQLIVGSITYYKSYR